jgi:hypothetical protein
MSLALGALRGISRVPIGPQAFRYQELGLAGGLAPCFSLSKAWAGWPGWLQAFRYQKLGLAGGLPQIFRYQKLGLAGQVGPKSFTIKSLR